MTLKCGKNKSDPGELVSGGGEGNTAAEAMTMAAHNFLKSLANAEAGMTAWASQDCPDDCPIKQPQKPAPEYEARNFIIRPKPNGKWKCVIEVVGTIKVECKAVRGRRRRRSAKVENSKNLS